MSTIKANAYLDASGGNTATINGLTPISLTTLNASGSAPVFACRAWVNFNGTGTVAIRASGNVSSITDNGTGIYTINFTEAMTDINFVVCSQSIVDSSGSSALWFVAEDIFVARTTTSVRIRTGYHSANVSGGVSSYVDVSTVTVAIFR
jgi:hypothetical protein